LVEIREQVVTQPNTDPSGTDTGTGGNQNPDPNPPSTDRSDKGAADKGAPQFSGDFDPQKAAQLFANLRSENEAEKAKRKKLEEDHATQEAHNKKQREELARLLGFAPADDDPKQTAKKLADTQDKYREIVIENAVYKAAMDPKVGANPTKLTDSRSFMAKVGQLDPESASFNTDIAKAVSAAVSADPSLKVATSGSASGGGKSARSGANFSTGVVSNDAQPVNAHQRLMRAYDNG